MESVISGKTCLATANRPGKLERIRMRYEEAERRQAALAGS